MSDVLFLYKKMTMSGSMDLGEDSFKFSVNLSKKYTDMLNELTNRSGLARAQIARMLLCTALDEIDEAYNLQNRDDFDYEATLVAEERLRDLDEARIMYEIDKEQNRIAGLRLALENAKPETEEDHKLMDRIRQEVEAYDRNQKPKCPKCLDEGSPNSVELLENGKWKCHECSTEWGNE